MNAQSAGPAPATPATPAKGRGRPRSEPARQAILAASADLLLARGLSAVSMDAIAERAGVSKATIYRWWPTKETLALDALYEQLTEPNPEPPDTGSLAGDLSLLLSGWMKRARSAPYARVIGALVTEAATDASFGELYRARYIEPRRAQARIVMARALERGELPAGTDVEAALDLLYGPVYHRLLHGHAPLTPEFADYVVRTVIAGLRNGAQEAGAGQAARSVRGK
jgi:AcrR family transcriptional regulator